LALKPHNAGIPGARGSLFEKFERDIGPVDVATYKARAAQLRPPVPWLILALYHRGMLQIPRPDWATERLISTSAVTAIDERFDVLVKNGLQPTSRIIDAGCGWGRFAMLLIPYLSTGCYHGLDIDEFELRGFIQFEIGIERPELATKQPHIMHSSTFEFLLLTGGSQDIDFVVFSSVLNQEMPSKLRALALCNAAQVLRAGGKVQIFNDCGTAGLRELASQAGYFGDLKPAGKNACKLERNEKPFQGCPTS